MAIHQEFVIRGTKWPKARMVSWCSCSQPAFCFRSACKDLYVTIWSSGPIIAHYLHVFRYQHGDLRVPGCLLQICSDCLECSAANSVQIVKGIWRIGSGEQNSQNIWNHCNILESGESFEEPGTSAAMSLPPKNDPQKSSGTGSCWV